MIRGALTSFRGANLARWLPSSQQGAMPLILQASSVKSTTPVSFPRFRLIRAAAFSSAEPRIAFNHSQVTIIDDRVLIAELRQSCTTIRKAIRSSKALHPSLGSELLSLNQMVRWINTKEEHCNKIIALVSEHSLDQRVKPSNFKSEMGYLPVEAMKIHHRTMQAAMKAKQSMDEADCIVLEHAVEDLSNMYSKET